MRWRHLHAPVGPRELPATCQSGRPHPSPPPRGAAIAGPPPPPFSSSAGFKRRFHAAVAPFVPAPFFLNNRE
jgi:hypothetical protein